MALLQCSNLKIQMLELKIRFLQISVTIHPWIKISQGKIYPSKSVTGMNFKLYQMIMWNQQISFAHKVTWSSR